MSTISTHNQALPSWLIDSQYMCQIIPYFDSETYSNVLVTSKQFSKIASEFPPAMLVIQAWLCNKLSHTKLVSFNPHIFSDKSIRPIAIAIFTQHSALDQSSTLDWSIRTFSKQHPEELATALSCWIQGVRAAQKRISLDTMEAANILLHPDLPENIKKSALEKISVEKEKTQTSLLPKKAELQEEKDLDIEDLITRFHESCYLAKEGKMEAASCESGGNEFILEATQDIPTFYCKLPKKLIESRFSALLIARILTLIPDEKLQKERAHMLILELNKKALKQEITCHHFSENSPIKGVIKRIFPAITEFHGEIPGVKEIHIAYLKQVRLEWGM